MNSKVLVCAGQRGKNIPLKICASFPLLHEARKVLRLLFNFQRDPVCLTKQRRELFRLCTVHTCLLASDGYDNLLSILF